MQKILLSALVLSLGCIATAANAATYSGAINADGSQQVPSKKYTVTHPSTGRYILTWAKPLTPYSSCLFQANGANVIVNGLAESATFCDVTLVNANSGTPTDTLFEFIAVNFTD
jgi:hypothetical protein